MSELKFGSNLFLKRLEDLSGDEIEYWNRHSAEDLDLRRSFMTYTFVKAVQKALGNVFILVLQENNIPKFILPMQRVYGPIGALGIFEPPGGVMTDYFGAIARPGVKIDIDRVLAATKGKVNAIVFSHLDETQVKFGLTGSEYRIGLRTRMGCSSGEFWTNLRKSDKKLVYDTERREKKLQADAGSIAFEWTSQAPVQDMAWLVEAKKSQYTRTGKTLAPLFNQENVALLLNLLASTDPACHGQLSVLRCGEDIVAAHFGLRFNEVFHVWFPVYNSKYSQYSPGRILFKHMFMAGAAAGITIFDRGEGDNQAKRDFANEEHYFAKGLWISPSLQGQIARTALTIKWRIERWLTKR